MKLSTPAKSFPPLCVTIRLTTDSASDAKTTQNRHSPHNNRVNPVSGIVSRESVVLRCRPLAVLRCRRSVSVASSSRLAKRRSMPATLCHRTHSMVPRMDTSTRRTGTVGGTTVSGHSTQRTRSKVYRQWGQWDQWQLAFRYLTTATRAPVTRATTVPRT